MSIIGNPITLGGGAKLDLSNTRAVIFKSLSGEFSIGVTDSGSGAMWSGSLYWANAKQGWTLWADQTIPIQSAGGIIALRGVSVAFSATATRHFTFNSIDSIYAYGGIVGLITPNTMLTPYNGRFQYIFKDCQNLVQAPDLDAPNAYYQSTFQGCTGLIYPPSIRLTSTTDINLGSFMSTFEGCTSMRYAPDVPFISMMPAGSFKRMCFGCTSLETLPTIRSNNIKYASFMGGGALEKAFAGCTKIKLSTTQTGNYTIPWSIPDYTGVNASALTDMFADTGGTFTGTPIKGTVYYLHNGQADS